MLAFASASQWFVLVTLISGLITNAAIARAVLAVPMGLPERDVTDLLGAQWLWFPISVPIVVLTQVRCLVGRRPRPAPIAPATGNQPWHPPRQPVTKHAAATSLSPMRRGATARLPRSTAFVGLPLANGGRASSSGYSMASWANPGPEHLGESATQTWKESSRCGTRHAHWHFIPANEYQGKEPPAVHRRPVTQEHLDTSQPLVGFRLAGLRP